MVTAYISITNKLHFVFCILYSRQSYSDQNNLYGCDLTSWWICLEPLGILVLFADQREAWTSTCVQQSTHHCWAKLSQCLQIYSSVWIDFVFDEEFLKVLKIKQISVCSVSTLNFYLHVPFACAQFYFAWRTLQWFVVFVNVSIRSAGADNHIDDDRYQNHGKEKFLRHTCNLLDA